jgi:hypothetical protein
MKPYLHDNRVFMWNLDSAVGKGAANSVNSDVSYLQWYYTLSANFQETPPERKEIYRRVKITGICTGRDDDPLVQAIVAQQRALNHPVIDGKASALPGVAGSARLGGDHRAFFIIRLGARFATQFPDKWPRLDHIPGCPASVAGAVRAAIPKI